MNAPAALTELEYLVVAQAAAAARLLGEGSPWAVAEREAAADRVVDLMAARAWYRRRRHPMEVTQACHRCVAYTVAADAAAAAEPGGGGSDRSAVHRAVGEALLLLTAADHFDTATSVVRALLGAAPDGRLLAAWRTVDDALTALGTTRHEWVGAEPGTVAAAGWVLVDRIGRLLTCAALVAEAAATAGAVDAVESEELLVNAARRYAWNHLRRPAPEAATPTHVQRSADLVRSVVLTGVESAP